MKKFSLAATVIAIIMLVATNAMAKDTYVPVHSVYMVCEHQTAKTEEYETPNEDGGFCVSRHEMHWYNSYQDKDECHCRLTVASEEYGSTYFDEEKFNREFHPMFGYIEIKPIVTSSGFIYVGSRELIHTYKSMVK